MKSQKRSMRSQKSQTLGSNYTFKDRLAVYHTDFANKCISNSFQFLANDRDIYFTWVHSTLMITF